MDRNQAQFWSAAAWRRFGKDEGGRMKDDRQIAGSTIQGLTRSQTPSKQKPKTKDQRPKTYVPYPSSFRFQSYQSGVKPSHSKDDFAARVRGCYHQFHSVFLIKNERAAIHIVARKMSDMSDKHEEQPNFKVTDRRLFNADGSPRDLPPEEKPQAPAAVQPPVAPVEAAPAVEAPAPSAAPPSEPIVDEHEPDDGDEELTEEEMASAQDPASFLNFLMSIASNAAAALGMMEHPVTHQREVDVELGKHWIDVLGMLEKKTKGNLTAQEQKMLTGLLSDLRMQYVSLANATTKPKGFSGRDITGGR